MTDKELYNDLLEKADQYEWKLTEERTYYAHVRLSGDIKKTHVWVTPKRIWLEHDEIFMGSNKLYPLVKANRKKGKSLPT
jgi:hypothetical protein